ncbi:putative lipid II flippase FtsW [Desulfocurvibacter africanus]|uniref:putative lipid II flippase FtsW n=1 Tax=Desulfocurvibacter africanus TaxID=873 RepID=UPI000428BF35|nr:putative lipid II flippase FtsW [Desulfocurvibacter africanus]
MNERRAERMERRGFDYLLLAAALVLLGLGLVMVLSASGVMAEKYMGNKYHFFIRQAGFSVAGLFIMTIAWVFPRERLYSLSYLWIVGAIFLLALALWSPLRHEANGAFRWLRLGSFVMQPLELAKLALVVYLANFYSAKQDLLGRFSVAMVPPLLVTGILAGLLLMQPDFGGASFLFLLMLLMALAGGVRLTHLGAVGIAAACAAVVLVSQSPNRMRRVFAFVDPFVDPLDTGYQLVQSLYALGSGHIFGVGLGAGKQKLFFLPEAHNDFLVAVIGEELGFIGVSALFLLVGVLLWRGFVIAWSRSDLRDRLFAFGLTSVLGLGFVLNMAVVLGAAPPKGVPMPFLSYGGSNLVVSFATLGLLLNLSRNEG